MRWRRPTDVAVVDTGDSIYVARLPHGPILDLAGPAAEVLRAVERSDGRVPMILTEVARAMEVPEAELDPEALADFLSELEQRGVIRQEP